MATNIVAHDAEQVVQQAVELLVHDLQTAIKANGTAVWIMAGGTLPLQAYQLLGRQYIDALDWSKVVVVVGDERCVPLDSIDSNWGEAERLFLQKVTVADASVRPQPELNPDAMAQAYEAALQPLLRFDVVWLGVGEDGHTLSLFPGRETAAQNEQLVVAVHDSPKPPADRISLTLKALTRARKVYVLAAGAGKQTIVAQAQQPDATLPIAQAVRAAEAAGGEVVWLLDEVAANG